MNTTVIKKQKHDKDWGDIICNPDGLEYSEVIDYLESCPPILGKKIAKVLGYEKRQTVKAKIPAKKLKLPNFKDRFEYEVADDEIECIDKIPLDVVYSEESRKFIVIRGIRYYREGLNQNLNSFTCNILSEVNFDYETSLARIIYVLKDHKPFDVLEQARCLFEAKKIIITNIGKDLTYSPGGDRRSSEYKKLSLTELLINEMPFKKYRIQVLLRFGNHIGLLAIEGLHYLLKSKNENLSIYCVHRMNPKLKKIRLRVKIEEMIRDMKSNSKSEIEIRDAVAVMVYDVLLDKFKQPTPGKRANKGNDSNDDKKNQNGKNSNDTKKNEDDKSLTPPKYFAVDPKSFARIKKLYGNYFKEAERILKFFNPKKKLTELESEELHKMIETRDNLNVEFKMVMLKAIFGR